MENVTGQLRFRDGRPMVAAYRHNETVWAFTEHGCHCDVFDAWKFNTVPHAIMPVDPPKVWRPFRDLAEAFKVMGSTPWIRANIPGHRWQQIQAVDEDGVFVGGERYSLSDAYGLLVWALGPSQTTGNRCGVEE